MDASFLDDAARVLHEGFVIHPDTGTRSVLAPTVYDGARSQAIGLSIIGDDLMLGGRFDHWTPVATEGTAGDGAAQIFFDVTGVARADDQDELFSFSSRSVERLGSFAYLAKGVMRAGELEQPMEVVVQTPPAHTPFVVLTLSLDRGAFPEIWEDLTVAAGRSDNSGQLHPRAWLRSPVLASA